MSICTAPCLVASNHICHNQRRNLFLTTAIAAHQLHAHQSIRGHLPVVQTNAWMLALIFVCTRIGSTPPSNFHRTFSRPAPAAKHVKHRIQINVYSNTIPIQPLPPPWLSSTFCLRWRWRRWPPWFREWANPRRWRRWSFC